MTRTLKLISILGGGAIACALIVSHVIENPEPQPDRGPQFIQPAKFAAIGDEIAPLRLRDLDGQEVVLGGQTKQPLLVHFWASWCEPCVKELPAYESAFSSLKRQGVRLVSVALDDHDHAEDVVRRYGVTFPVLLAGDGNTNPAMSLGSKEGAVPFTVILDTHGAVVFQQLGTAGDSSNILGWAHKALKR